MIKGKLIKVCGMRQEDNIRSIACMKEPDLMGFIFYPKSPRMAHPVPTYLPADKQRVGVFVNQEMDSILTFGEAYKLHYIQLHGQETPAFCHQVKQYRYKIIKVFSVADEADLDPIADYEGLCDFFLFDTKCKSYGGSGNRFNWGILDKYTGKTPFFLSGGIGPDSVMALHNFTHPLLAGYDLNSRFEISPGIKDYALLERFFKELSI